MNTTTKPSNQTKPNTQLLDEINLLKIAIQNSWSKIAPSWPLKNLIAVNPIAGFEDLNFEDGLTQAHAYFQQSNMPEPMQHINRQSIKWLQAFFDEGQATINMPMRHRGLLKSTMALLKFDNKLGANATQILQLFEKNQQNPQMLIAQCLLYLEINTQDHERFLTLMLTTLPGWAAYVQYRTNWADAQDLKHPHPVTHEDYLGLRLILTCLLWQEAKSLLTWHTDALLQTNTTKFYANLTAKENTYINKLADKLKSPKSFQQKTQVQAQLVFCIDVRSEPFRRNLESQGHYATYGFAGFFGVPVTIENAVTKNYYASCPVLLKPAHKIVEHPICSYKKSAANHQRTQRLKKLYQSVKYTFTIPFSLAEAIGLASGIWMALKSFSPKLTARFYHKLQNLINPAYAVKPSIEAIPFEAQVDYALNALTMLGLTHNFAPLVVFCGHGSSTQNNAYATALDCGACGGQHGGSNARILADILNMPKVRQELTKHSIIISSKTHFIAAEHNTTTDDVKIYDSYLPQHLTPQLKDLKKDLKLAQIKNTLERSINLDESVKNNKSVAHAIKRSQDWAQVRPEWGLATNAAFIIGPRQLTQDINLKGQVFLHSYDWEQDADLSSLTKILTAPMVVAQWINAQYFFSALDNVAFGGGSKVTKNITGKIGIMQGNASDLMTGLPLQSINKTDTQQYHEPMRLTVFVCAPQSYINPIITNYPILKKLLGNGWVHLVCMELNTQQNYRLQRDFTWMKIN